MATALRTHTAVHPAVDAFGDPVDNAGTTQGMRGTTAGITAAMSDGAVLAALDAAFERRRDADAEIVFLSGEVLERSRPSLGAEGLASRLGETSPAAVVASTGRVGVAEARRVCRLGDATRLRLSLVGEVLPPLFPAVASALAAGTLGVEAATHIVTALTQAAPRAVPSELAEAEGALVGFAGSNPADMVRVLATRCRDALDTDGVEPREAELIAGRSLRRMLLPNGLTRFRLDLDPLSAAYLNASIDTAVNAAIRRVGFVDTRAAGTEGTVGGADGDITAAISTDDEVPDPRTLTQIGADAVVDLARHANDCTHIHIPAPSATIIVRMTLESLLTGLGTASIDGCGQSITATTARLLAADAHLIPMVLGGDGEVLDLGRSRRLFTRTQRLALAERDQGCAFPTCDRPPSWAEAHHIRWWSLDGPTDLANGVLLCTRHHHTVHSHGWGIRIRDNIPWFIPPPTIDATRTPRRGGPPPTPLARSG